MSSFACAFYNPVKDLGRNTLCPCRKIIFGPHLLNCETMEAIPSHHTVKQEYLSCGIAITQQMVLNPLS